MNRERIYFGRGEPSAPDPGGRLPTALAVPGGEGVAMSTLGWQAVYRLLAQQPDLAVERVFLEKSGRGGDAEPRARESGRTLSSFPVIAWSVTFEEDYLQLGRALRAASLPLRSEDRPDFPLLLCGGPVAFLNPAPIAPFMDLFWVGEADEGLVSIFTDLKQHIYDGGTKAEFLDMVKDRPGVYVPGKSATPVQRVATTSTPGHLSDPCWSCFTSQQQTFKDTLLMEVNRGCPYGCRFCAAGFIYRPPRHADIDTLKEIVEFTNPHKVGLVGTALTDWDDLLDYLKWLHERGTKFTLSSLRADGITEEFITFLRKHGIRTVTLALEGASERIRKAAGKKLKIEDFLNAVRMCARFGVNHLKLYCIVGWPGETDADYEELGELIARLIEIRSEEPGGRKKSFMRITLSCSSLVPKPFTPFQWSPMMTEANLNARFKSMKKMAKPYKGFTLNHDNPWQARLQALLSLGSEQTAEFIELALDGGWKKALKRWDEDPGALLDHERGREEVFPWEVIDVGVQRDLLWREWERAKELLDT